MAQEMINLASAGAVFVLAMVALVKDQYSLTLGFALLAASIASGNFS